MRPDPIDQRTIALLRDTAHDGDPRTYLAECAGCGRPFWVLVGRAGRSLSPQPQYSLVNTRKYRCCSKVKPLDSHHELIVSRL